MGLDTSHECWHGSYGAFNRWRDKLAEVAGYTFHPDGHGKMVVDLDWGAIEATIGRLLLGEWSSIPVRHDGTPDPLIILIAHQDCEGILQNQFLVPLAKRLEELMPQLKGQDGFGHIGDYGKKTQTFIDGLRRAAELGDDVEFA